MAEAGGQLLLILDDFLALLFSYLVCDVIKNDQQRRLQLPVDVDELDVEVLNRGLLVEQRVRLQGSADVVEIAGCGCSLKLTVVQDQDLVGGLLEIEVVHDHVPEVFGCVRVILHFA